MVHNDLARHDASSGSTPPATEGAPLRFRERVKLRAGSADLLVFLVGRERFAVELRSVEEVVENPELRAIPESPRGLLGVFPLREQLLALYASAQVLGPHAQDGHVALVMRSATRRWGLAVDDVDDVITVSLAALCDPPPGVNDDEVVAGLIWHGGLLITVLDARALASACTATAVPSAA
jgi:purine-binding chemotaxis protein CheW